MNQDRLDLVDSLRDLLKVAMPEQLGEQVELINALRVVLHEASPFAGEPVDLVQWVPAESVHANSYNPNAVAPPEMELLRLSIMADGYTQPIVTNLDEDRSSRTVIDGFHRNRVGKECEDVAHRIRGYLPVVQIKSDRTDRGDQIAATIRHNRARGKHAVSAMADIVLELKRRNWSDKKIGIQLGMDDDEVLRLAQITGLAEAFANREFSKSWEAVITDDDSDDLDDAALTDLVVDGELTDLADADA
jgi:ParB-like chromosome segregation protein Spo0J